MLAGNSARGRLGSENVALGIQDRLSQATTVSKETINRFDPKKCRKIFGHGKIDRRFGEQKCVRSGGNSRSGVLFNIFHNSEKREQMESNFGPIKSQQICSEGEIQDGYSRVNSTAVGRGRLRGVAGPVRCVPSHSHSPQSSEVSSFHVPWENISIQSLGDGFDYVSKDFYSGYKSDAPAPSITGGSSVPVSGRLVDSWEQRGTSESKYSENIILNREARMDCKYGKIGVRTCSEVQVPFIQLPSRSAEGSSHRRKMGEDSGENSTIGRSGNLHSTRVAVCAGVVDINREAGEYGDVAYSPHSVGHVDSMVSVQRRPETSTSAFSNSKGMFKVVDGKGKCHDRSTDCETVTKISNVHRCQPGGLGWNTQRHGGTWEMVSGGDSVSHQRFGVNGNFESATTFPGCGAGINGNDSLRQCNGVGLHSQARGNKVNNPVERNTGTVSMAGSSQSGVTHQTHSREIEHFGRFVVTEGTNTADRVVNESKNPAVCMVTMGNSTGGYVRDKTQQSACKVCVTCAGQSGVGCRCYGDKLGQSDNLRVSSNSDFIHGAQEDEESSVSNDFDSAILAKAKVVSSTSGSVSGFSQGNSVLGKTVETAKINDISPEPRDIQVTRVEVVKRAYREKGFSAEVAERMSRAQKASSLKVYEGKWKIFSDWCGERNRDPLETSVIDISELLVYLRDAKKLQPRTIEGYRTAIGNTLKVVKGLNIGQDVNLSNLMASFYREREEKSSNVPWNLALVLRKLSQEPFEPIMECELKYLTWKTVFLLALATGKRRSELHAMRHDILHTENWQAITILPDPEFVAKTQLSNRGGEVLNAVTVKALSQFLSAGLEDDKFMCPVRAVRVYLQRTRDIRGDRRKLFVSYKSGFEKEIHANTISSWLKKTILLCYGGVSEEDQKITGVKAHQVRSVAASWAFHENVSMDTIMSACTWKSHNTFSSYYLKDLAWMKEEMYSLGPVVVAGASLSTFDKLPKKKKSH